MENKNKAKKDKKPEENTDKPVLDIKDLPIRQATMAMLLEQGLSTEEAGEAVGYKKGTAYVVKTKLNRYSLTNQKIVKKANNVVQNILDGKPLEVSRVSIDKRTGEPIPYTDHIYPAHQTQLNAAGMVYDRFEAVKNADNSPTVPIIQAAVYNITINQAEVQKYQKEEEIEEIIDVVPIEKDEKSV